MTMQTDVLSAHTEATGTLVIGRYRLKGYQGLAAFSGAGDVTFRDGGATGPIRLRYNIPGNTNNPYSTLIPGQGIVFYTDIYVELPTSATITVFYG
jgi:hypothetical protein